MTETAGSMESALMMTEQQSALHLVQLSWASCTITARIAYTLFTTCSHAGQASVAASQC